MMAVVIRMPALAAGSTEATLQSWLVAVGESVAVGQGIADIETDKAVVEYSAEAPGVVAALIVGAGVAAAVGAPIAVLAEPGESVHQALAVAAPDLGAPARPDDPGDGRPTASAESTPVPPPVAAPEQAESLSEPPAPAPTRLFATPLVRRLAAERGIDLATIAGSGPRGRVVRRDLDALAAVRLGPAAEQPSAPVAATGLDEQPYVAVPHTRMRRAIARRLTESTATVPHFFLAADCRVDELLDLRSRINALDGLRVSVNDLVLKAVAGALQDVPEANAIWTDNATRRFSRVDIGVAISVPGGLVTPVVRGVESRSVRDLSETVRALADRAREGRLAPAELEGGSFAVSNLGMYGTQEFSAIINPPHSGILAVGAATKRPVVDAEGNLAVATAMTVTLSADHRVLDGALAAQLLAAFVTRIENPLSLLV